MDRGENVHMRETEKMRKGGSEGDREWVREGGERKRRRERGKEKERERKQVVTLDPYYESFVALSFHSQHCVVQPCTYLSSL